MISISLRMADGNCYPLGRSLGWDPAIHRPRPLVLRGGCWINSVRAEGQDLLNAAVDGSVNHVDRT